MAHYITAVDVTDSALQPLCNDHYLTRCDKDLQTLAAMRGVDVGDIETEPLHPLIVDWCSAKVCMRICLDKAGVNPQANAYGIGPLDDIYMAKLKIYRQEVARLEPIITAEVLKGTADEPKEFSGSFDLYRG